MDDHNYRIDFYPPSIYLERTTNMEICLFVRRKLRRQMAAWTILPLLLYPVNTRPKPAEWISFQLVHQHADSGLEIFFFFILHFQGFGLPAGHPLRLFIISFASGHSKEPRQIFTQRIYLFLLIFNSCPMGLLIFMLADAFRHAKKKLSDWARENKRPSKLGFETVHSFILQTCVYSHHRI